MNPGYVRTALIFAMLLIAIVLGVTVCHRHVRPRPQLPPALTSSNSVLIVHDAEGRTIAICDHYDDTTYVASKCTVVSVDGLLSAMALMEHQRSNKEQSQRYVIDYLLGKIRELQEQLGVPHAPTGILERDL